MDSTEPAGLRRELSVWEAIGISVALMAPSMAANINPQGTAGLVGRPRRLVKRPRLVDMSRHAPNVAHVGRARALPSG